MQNRSLFIVPAGIKTFLNFLQYLSVVPKFLDPHTGVFSNQFIEKLRRIGNFGEGRL